MINRELIRIKTVQLTYAYYQNGSKNIESAEKELLFSLSKAYDMYAYLLALIVGITKESRRHLEVAQARAQREGTEMPSQKFAYNRFALQLEENKMLNELMETQKKSWNDNPEFLKKLYLQITESQIYHDYMADEQDDYAADREVWRKIYRTLIQNNDDLDALLRYFPAVHHQVGIRISVSLFCEKYAVQTQIFTEFGGHIGVALLIHQKYILVGQNNTHEVQCFSVLLI